jgi:restriction system protein
MGRKDDSILNLLVGCPWWGSLLASDLLFVFLRFILPSLNFQNPFINGMSKGLSGLAPFLALLLLIPAPISFFNASRKKRLLDSQRSLETLRKMNWREFEELVGEAYRRQGFAVEENPGTGPDEGIDLVLRKGGDLVLVQCKHWKAVKVDVKIVRELYGVMAGKKAPHGVVITSGMFTQDAKTFAADKPIDLVDGRQLLELIGTVRKTPGGRAAKESGEIVPTVRERVGPPDSAAGTRSRRAISRMFRVPRCRYSEPAQKVA